jgi:hypothetical protein
LVQATRGLPRQLATLSALSELTDRHCGPHDYAARGLGAPEKKTRVSRLDLRRHGPEAPPRSFGPPLAPAMVLRVP